MVGTRDQIIDYLKRSYKPNDIMLCDLWLPDDVLSRIEMLDVKGLEFNDVVQILRDVYDAQDATIGINWDSFDMAILEYKKENKE